MIDGPRVAPRSDAGAKSLVILLHGYGADGNDLIGLAEEWAPFLPDTAFVSPHAPEPCAGAPMGRQWFPLTMRDPHEYARGCAAAAPALEGFIEAESARHGIAEERIALVGFSQGTMMALHVGLRRRLAGIVGFSGLLADPKALPDGADGAPPVLLFHGDRDQVIPVGALMAAAFALSKAAIPVEWHVSPGVPHGIGPDGVQGAGVFLSRVLTFS